VKEAGQQLAGHRERSERLCVAPLKRRDRGGADEQQDQRHPDDDPGVQRPRLRGQQLAAQLKVVGAASGHAGVVKMGEDAGAALVDAASLLGAL